MAASVLGGLTFVGGAMAATPVSNGVYDDPATNVIVAMEGKSTIHGLDIVCHGKTWVATRLITVKGGKFSYKGPDFLAKNRHKTKTTGSMTASGVFKTSHLVTGSLSAGGCKVHYKASP
jgi:hypothetical protein